MIMHWKQKISIISPLLLILVMYPIIHLLAGAFDENWRIAWYLGLIIYWLIWGGVFTWFMIGKESLKRITKPQKLNKKLFFLVAFPLLMAGLYRFIPGMAYQKPNL